MKSAPKNKFYLFLLWFLEGTVVGFGAILPGISGGTLCVAFGMYRPIIETISHPARGLKTHGLTLLLFGGGIAAGFVGLSGLAARLLEQNTGLVTCAFIGFVLGTFPGLWQEAGAEGRGKGSYAAMGAAFLAMLAVLSLFKTTLSITVAPGIGGYLFCGLLWGLSFIVPGLSSSSLLMFFGLYQPMLAGISALDPAVLLPMACGMGGCVLLLSKAVGAAYERHFSLVSHGVLGVIAATVWMIFPGFDRASAAVWALLAIVGGAAVSFLFSRLCSRLNAQNAQ